MRIAILAMANLSVCPILLPFAVLARRAFIGVVLKLQHMRLVFRTAAVHRPA